MHICVTRPQWVNTPDSKVHGANMGPTWVLSAPDGPHVGPMNLAFRDLLCLAWSWLETDSSSNFFIYIVHYNDVIMGMMASQITSLAIIYSTVYSGADQGNIKAPHYWPFVWGIHGSPVNSPHKWPVMWKMFPFDDVIMTTETCTLYNRFKI